MLNSLTAREIAIPRSAGLVSVATGMMVVGIGVATMVFDLPPKWWIAAPIGVALAAAVVLYPFLGLLGVVFGAQVAGLIEKVGRVGDVALEALALLAIVGLAATSHRQPRSERFGPDALAIRFTILFLVAVLVSALFADNQALAWDGFRKRFNVVLLLWLIVRMVESVSRLRAVILAVALSTLMSTGLSVVGYATGFRAVVSPSELEKSGPVEAGRVRHVGAASQNATTASRMMLAGAALAAVIAIRTRKRRLIYGTTAVVGALGTLLTYSRSTSLVMILTGVWLLLKLRKHRRFPLVVTAAALVAVLFVSMMPAFYWERLSELRNPGEDPTLGRRLGYQLIGFDLLQSHPILGVGPENYKVHYLDFEYRYMPGRFMEARDLHNMYLSVAVETGLLGFACFASILFVALVGLSRVMRRAPGSEIAIYAEAIQLAFVVFLVSCLFGAVETNKMFWILTGVAISTGLLGQSVRIEDAPSSGATPLPAPRAL